MKRFIIAFFCLLFFINIQLPFTVFAQEKKVYLRIAYEDTPFYTDKDCSELICYLPYSYYVLLLEKYENAFHVEVGGDNLTAVDGFVPKEFLIDENLSVCENPYPVITLTTLDTATLFSDHTLQKPLQYLFKNRSLQYYGYYKNANGDYYYFVCYNDKFGFVLENYISPFVIAPHPNPFLNSTEKNEESSFETESSNTTNNNFFGIKVAVYICLALAGIIALVFALKPKKPKSHAENFYDENEYE